MATTLAVISASGVGAASSATPATATPAALTTASATPNPSPPPARDGDCHIAPVLDTFCSIGSGIDSVPGHVLGSAASGVGSSIASAITNWVAGGAAWILGQVADLLQSWWPAREDFDRFICRAVKRRMYEMPDELHASGRRLSGFVFGKGDVVARIYDKTLEMRTRGQTWLEEVWNGRVDSDPVWRIEVQFRRAALRAFRITELEHALHARQGLWEYGTTWLSLRRPTKHVDRDRWPEASEWTSMRETWMGSPRSLLVREHQHQADVRRLVQGLVGYATSLAAAEDNTALAGVVTREIPAAARYVCERGEPIEAIVERKRRQRIPMPLRAVR